ncbi:hypothetical protein D3C80_1877220 [compost metagenome]
MESDPIDTGVIGESDNIHIRKADDQGNDNWNNRERQKKYDRRCDKQIRVFVFIKLLEHMVHYDSPPGAL